MAKQSPAISFELFPPKTPKGFEALKGEVAAMSKADPKYISVTYGAGGTTRDKTEELVSYVQHQTANNAAAHLTCVSATKQSVLDIAKGYIDDGVNHIVALRGDPPNMQGKYQPFEGGYAYAADMVGDLRKLSDNLEISVAAFPEVHPEATSAKQDLAFLKDKLAAGANQAIMQYCFDTDTILRFLDQAAAIGITKPIVPGIITIQNFAQVTSFSARCGASIPSWLTELFDGVEPNSEEHHQKAIEVAYKQCQTLVDAGVDELHFYTLNKADLSLELCANLGLV